VRQAPWARVALCHEWLSDRCGSEKTFEAMAGALPDADLYALTHDPRIPFDLGSRPVTTTFLDRLPAPVGRPLQLPLMPLAWRLATRERYDLVVSSSHACAKGFWPGRQALHLSYCYTPMRYAWVPDVDTRARPGPARALAGPVLRRWDRASAAWVDEFAAISRAVRDRVRAFYGREATVIHPPVDTDFYAPSPGSPRRHGVLVASRMVPYKRIDLAIRAGHVLGLPVTVAGTGPEEAALRRLAARLGAHTDFVIGPDDATLRRLYRSASVLVFTAHEDFGIVPVEAQACGTPVVALDEGGSRDTVIDGVTGVLVAGQEATTVAAGIARALELRLEAEACRANAERFARSRFTERFLAWVAASAERHGLGSALAPAP